MTAYAYQPAPPPALPAGRVRLGEGDRCTVTLDDGSDLVARRAASCLLAPEPGDRVLLTLQPEPFVLAVLERDHDRAARLEVRGDAVMTTSGELTLEGNEGVAVRTCIMMLSIIDCLRGEERIWLRLLTGAPSQICSTIRLCWTLKILS